jgi:hypothetical protein
MGATTSIRTALSVVAITFALGSAAHAVSSRTYVSNLGSDSNTSSNCGHPAPCATFAAAYGVTAAGGEIVALDVAGYGPLTITGPVTITGIAGALVNVVSNTTGILVATSNPTDKVILRNLQISGAAGSTTTTGIQVASGRLVLQNSTLRGLGIGLSVTPNIKSDVMYTDIIGNTTGISTDGTGTSPNFTSPPNGPTQVRIIGGSVVDNITGFFMTNVGADQSQNINSTILISNSPMLTYIAGNATTLACHLASCIQVLGYQSSLLGASNAN